MQGKTWPLEDLSKPAAEYTMNALLLDFAVELIRSNGERWLVR
jgi:hypothetical protein